MSYTRSTWITLACLLAILLVVGVLAWWSQRTAENNQPPTAIEAALTKASTTVFTDLTGAEVAVALPEDAVVIAHSWATWVPSSQQSLADLALLQEEYAAQNVRVLAINRKEAPATAQRFLDRFGSPDIELVIDTNDSYFAQVGGQTMPETVFYSASGEIVSHQKRPLSLDELREFTEAALVAASTPEESGT